MKNTLKFRNTRTEDEPSVVIRWWQRKNNYISEDKYNNIYAIKLTILTKDARKYNYLKEYNFNKKYEK